VELPVSVVPEALCPDVPMVVFGLVVPAGLAVPDELRPDVPDVWLFWLSDALLTPAEGEMVPPPVVDWLD